MNIKYKILIVEDNPSDIELAQREIRQVLKSVEFSDLCTREEFLDSLKTFKPDIIISDYSMPVFDGLSVIHLARKEAPLVPVIIFTGSLNEETAAETVKAGATDYVLKENNLRLRQAVLNALEIKQMWIEQRESQEKLRVSEERYRILFEQAADGIFQGDPNGNFIGANASGAQITGYSLKELSKMNMRDLFTEEEIKREPFKYELLKKGQVVRRERTITRKDGTTCEVEMNTKMLPDKTYMAVIRDITQRKKTERELKESEERLSNLINTIPIGVVIHSDEKFVFGNTAAFNIMETNPNTSYIGANVLDFIDPASEGIIIERLRNTIKKGKIDPIVAGFKTATGKKITVELNSIPLMYKGVPSIMTVFNDISKRMRAEKELRDSEERYSNLIKLLPIGIAIHNNGEIVFANETATKFFEVPAGKTIIGAKIMDYLHPDYHEMVTQRIKKSLTDNVKATPNEEVFLTFTGKAIPVEVTSMPIVYKDVKSLLTVFADISARKKAETKLIESEAKYRSFFENTGTATAIIEEDSTISLSNTKFVELVGIAKEELENKRKWTEFVVPEDLDRMMKMHILRRKDPSKALRAYEFNLKDVKGNIRNIMLYVDIIPGTNKSLASLLDITAIKNATREIVENEKRFRNIIELANISLSIVAFDGTIEYINQQAIKTFGYQHSDIPNMDRWWAQAYPDEKYRKEVVDHWTGLVNKAIKGNKEIERNEYRATCKDGSVKTMIIFGVIVNDKVICLFEDITERKIAEEELRKSRLLLRTMIDSLPIWISAVDLDGNYFIANKYYETFFKRPLALIEGHNFKEFFTEKDYKKHKAYFDECLSSKKSIEISDELTGENGAVVYMYGTYTPLFDEKGVLFGMAALAMDITRQKEAEIALKESEEQFRTTFVSAPIGMCLNPVDGNFYQANQSFCDMMGYTQEELRKFNFTDITFPDDIEASKVFVQNVLAQKNTSSFIEKRYIRKDGTVIWAITSIAILKDINHKPRFFIIQVLDITKLKQTEQKLKEAKHQLELVFNNGPDAILLTRVTDGFYIDSNKTFTKYTGYTPDDLRGKSTLDIDIWNDPKDRDTLLHEVQSKGYCHNLELVVKNKNGSFRTIEMSAEVIVIKGVPCLLSISRDIAERKRMEDLLQKQNNELKDLVATKDRFFSIIAHDLKDPHNAILGFSEILSGSYDMLSEQDRKNYIKNILLSSQALARLLQNLLEWAGSQTGKMVYKPEKLDLEKLIQETIDLLHYQAKIKQIRLVSDINSAPIIYADNNMTKTVLRNLVSNAIKFTRRNGFVKISTVDVQNENTNSNFVEISVIDNGIGIKKENLPNLFRLDYKIKTQGTEEETGSGLGLILCKELIEKNKGSLSINSEENVGTTVSFTIPQKAIK